MAYIKDYLVKENSLASSNYLTPKTIQYSRYENQGGQLRFEVCDMVSYVGYYLSQDIADSRQEFDDVDFA